MKEDDLNVGQAVRHNVQIRSCGSHEDGRFLDSAIDEIKFSEPPTILLSPQLSPECPPSLAFQNSRSEEVTHSVTCRFLCSTALSQCQDRVAIGLLIFHFSTQMGSVAIFER